MDERAPRPRDDADAKAWFYLDRRRDIEEWAALRPDAAELFDRCLIALAPNFEQLADELGAEYDPQLRDDTNFRWLGVRRASWKDSGLHAVTIGLQWYPDKLFQPHNANEWPFLGIYVPVQGQDLQRRRSLADGLADLRSALGGKATGDWLYWRYVRPTDRPESVDPDELARTALQEFRKLWAAATPILDAHR